MIPSFFIAHGAPLLAIEDNTYTEFLSQLGRTIPRPKAVVLFSAHWEADTQQVGDAPAFDTIYDFGGFPEALYQIKYPAQGAHDVASELQDLFSREGVSFAVDNKRGLDHGAWVVLRLLYPEADVPVVSMSVNPALSPEEQFKIGKALAELRKQDVLIIASGGTVHNLRALNWHSSGVDDWALQFDEWLATHLKTWDLEALFDYQARAPHANLAVPPHGSEHFIPIFYAIGAADGSNRAELLHRSYQYGNLSHSVWQFG